MRTCFSERTREGDDFVAPESDPRRSLGWCCCKAAKHDLSDKGVGDVACKRAAASGLAVVRFMERENVIHLISVRGSAGCELTAHATNEGVDDEFVFVVVS
jgi:hypothetical protein